MEDPRTSDLEPAEQLYGRIDGDGPVYGHCERDDGVDVGVMRGLVESPSASCLLRDG